MGACCAAREESTKVALGDTAGEKGHTQDFDQEMGFSLAEDDKQSKKSNGAVAVSTKTLEVSDTGSLKGETATRQFYEYQEAQDVKIEEAPFKVNLDIDDPSLAYNSTTKSAPRFYDLRNSLDGSEDGAPEVNQIEFFSNVIAYL